ncbi:single-stranded DNA-binding protein [Ochrobactrum sp. S1502_03]|uniref:single-stranded DNA-binding protein n=1 Tax=Ochrobactrum sp. S1502_03 TaxID=3108451 RepID=UPI0037C7BAB2
MSLNRHEMIGRLGADPEVRRTNSGDMIVSMRIVTSDVWRDRDTGEKKEKSEWHTVVIFNQNLAKIAEQYLKKGNIVFISGKIRTRKWEDQNGNTRYSTETVLESFGGELQLLPQGNGSGRGTPSPDDYGDIRTRDQSNNTQSPGNYSNQSGGGFSRDLDDEIPFAPEWRG